MIVLDIETSGLDMEKCGIWQIGAIEVENPKNYFLEEGKIDDSDIIQDSALKVIGKTEEYLREKNKKTQKELLESFFIWASKIRNKDCICQNPQFDLIFLTIKSNKYGINYPLPYRSYDLHSIAQLKYFQVKKEFLNKSLISNMGLSNILLFCGIPDNRKDHNALEDSRLTLECFYRIVYSKPLLLEYKNCKMPNYLELT